MRKLTILLLVCACSAFAQFNSGVVTNGDFENGANNWSFYSNGSATFTVTTSGAYSGSSAYVNVTTVGNNTQLYQQPISMQGSTSYTLTFYAKGSNARTVYMSVLQDASPFTNYGLNTVPAVVTTSWTQYSLTFTSPTASVSDGRLRFDFGTAGQSGDQFWIDNVSLLSSSGGGGGTGTLQSDNFSSGSLNSFWSKVDVPGGGTVAVVSNQMVLTVPANSPHDGYTSGDNALLGEQATGDINFTATAQFATVPGTLEGEGLQAIQDSTHFVRCDITNYGDGSGNHVYAAYISGATATVYYNNAFTSASQYWVRLGRSGTNWTCSVSTDGTNYSTLASFSQQITMSGVAIDADVGTSGPSFAVRVVNFTSGSSSNPGNGGTAGSGVRGRPKIVNNFLVADDGAQLHCVSAHISDPLFSEFLAQQSWWTQLQQFGNFNCVRAAAYLGNWVNNGPPAVTSTTLTANMDVAVANASATGMYLLLDNHSECCGSDNLSNDEAFWALLAGRYAANTNVIYEIKNEPDQGSDASYESYENTMYNYVRGLAPNTPLVMWSTAVPTALDAPLTIYGAASINYANAVVGLHPYSSPGDTQMETLYSSVHANFPVMNTEITADGSSGAPACCNFEHWMDSNGWSWTWLNGDGFLAANGTDYGTGGTVALTPWWPVDVGGTPPGNGGGSPGFNPGLITNGDFENGTTGWLWFTSGTGNFGVDTNQALAGSSADITISVAGSNTQLYQQPLTLAANTNYTFSFYAKANAARAIIANLQQIATPFTNYGISNRSFTLSTSWQQFSVTFNGPGGAVSDAQLAFSLGGSAQAGDEFWIDNVALIANGSSGTGGAVGSIQCQLGIPATPVVVTQPANSISVTSSPYNAPTNGTTDATSAIKAAISAASSGQTVWFPAPGTYLISAALPCKSGVNFASNGATLQATSRTAGMWMWSCTGVNLNGATWNGLILDGGGLNLSYDNVHEQQANVLNTTIQNLWYTGSGFNGSGIFVSGPGLANSKISGNTFSHIMANNSTRPTGTNSIDTNTLAGIMAYGLQNTSVDHNDFNYVAEAIHVCFESNETAQNVYFGYNQFNFTHRMAMELQGAPGCGGQYSHDSPDTEGMVIENNQILHWNDEYYWSYGISNANPEDVGCPVSILYSSNPTNCTTAQQVIHGGSDTIVRNNQIIGDDVPCRGTSPCHPGVGIETGSYANLVYGNLIDGAFGAGIEVSGSPNALIHDNYACNPFGDGATFSDFIGDENGPTGATYTNNTVNANACPQPFTQVALGIPTVTKSVVTDTPSFAGILQTSQILGVQYLVDQAPFAAYSAVPWTLSAGTQSLVNGNHQLSSTATDIWCDQYTGGSQTFTVLNTAPTFLWPFQILGQVNASGKTTLK